MHVSFNLLYIIIKKRVPVLQGRNSWLRGVAICSYPHFPVLMSTSIVLVSKLFWGTALCVNFLKEY